ncbi:restriction endonuclease subunit S [Halopseudomonas salina]|uniref:Type-1 restriction enzyme EcoKI specificity protein n=1 Tax=Halopseudomonas salina TaxID=1323744 RepID=A0ABQ1PQN5_9GAMM|nr:restriction endonuclease subunit S [Halopseudomonas salina]GGD01607.1 type-1 restriction enzyme EcoKI specificity protein [Halopseudomonas salina]
MSGLPTGWAACQLSDIGQIVTGKTPSTKESRFYGGDIPFIKPGDLDFASPIFRTETYLTADGAAEIPSLPSQSIVVTCIGNLGKVGLTTTTSATNQQINAIIPHERIDPKFLFHYCKTLKPWLEAKSSATTISIVNKGIFSTAPTSLPPLAEQTRIAAKLDELLAQVDTLKARVDGIPALLKRFRQSVLAAAVSGRLTEEWRKDDSSKYKDLDFAYPVNRLGLLARFIDYRGKTPEKVGTGIPLITAKNIRSGYISREPREFIRPEAYEGWMTRGIPLVGDVLITTEAPLGNIAVIDITEKFALAQRAICLQFHEGFLSNFGAIALQSPLLQEELLRRATGTTVKGIKASVLKDIEVPVPTLAEQTEIVSRVEQLFAFADQLETRVKIAQTRIDRLTQSILAKAFRGELVPQDPNDEPASVLLERIKAQRAAAPKTKRGRKASA